METKHTPGPWKIRPTAFGRSGFYIETVDTSHDKTFIGDVVGGLQSQPEIEANAKLIAAAPEMLDVLDSTYQLMLVLGVDPTHPNMVAMDEAIKKATT